MTYIISMAETFGRWLDDEVLVPRGSVTLVLRCNDPRVRSLVEYKIARELEALHITVPYTQPPGTKHDPGALKVAGVNVLVRSLEER